MKRTAWLLFCLIWIWISPNVFAGFLDKLSISEEPLEWNFGENINVNLRGEVTYTARWRMNEPDDELVDDSSGNANFEKGDLTNNKVSTRLEVETVVSRYTLFASGEVFYDWVFTDKDRFNDEIRDHAQDDAEILDLYVEASFDKVVCRLGRQIVQWGESIAPVNAVAVNTVSPFNGIKATSAGYSRRDYQVQSLMAWISYEPVRSLSIEGVYNPDFEPRYMLPIVGTFGSPADIIGFGAVDSYEGIQIIDDRPEDFEDKQQYGFAVRKTFPNLKNLELGVYYYHHLNRSPVMSFTGFEDALTDPESLNITLSYPEQDMYGFSFSSVIDWLDLGVQMGGELALRPNAPMQLDYYVDAFEATILSSGGQPTRTGDNFGPLGGYEETQVLYWDLSFIYMLDYYLPYVGWSMTSAPIVEFYGLYNTEYEEHKFTDPEQKTYFMLMFDFTTYEMLDNWKTGLSFTYMDTLHEERYTEYSFQAGIDLKYGDNLSLLAAYTWKMGDVDQFVEFNTSDRDAFTFQATYYF